MQILDGKNHRRGAYEKVALDLILHVLLTGKHWGSLDFPGASQNYPSGDKERARTMFLNTFRALVDQWIDSGIDADGIETPSNRYVRGPPPGYSESLFDVLLGWLGRNMPRPALMNEGTIAILEQRPQLSGHDLEAYARESAIFYLKELLECENRSRLGRCRNPRCRVYFIRKRTRRGDIKRGSYCGKCAIIGAAERTRLSRQHRKDQQLDAAAVAWTQWKKNTRYPQQAEWTAVQVNRKFPRWPQIRVKWVTQNKQAILARVYQGSSSCPAM